MPASINITKHRLGDAHVYAVAGEMDLATVPELEHRLDFDVAEPTVVLDLSDVTFIDSTGLRTIVAAHEDAADGGKELRVVAGPKVTRLLEITGLHNRLAVYDNRSAALGDG